jgi:signal transduction histidine kinase
VHEGRAQGAFDGERIARELHDVTLQDLAALRLELARLAGAAADTALHPGLLAAQQRVRETIVNLRGLLADARPPALDRLGLAAALEVVADGWRRDAGVLVSLAFDVDEPVAALGTRVGAHAELAAFRIVQEAGRNAVRHGAPGRIDVELAETPIGLVLDVRDDGRGFDPEAPTAGHGLAVMRERAAYAGGRLVVVSRPGAGTAIRVRVPAGVGRRDGRFRRAPRTPRDDGLNARA